MALRNDPVYRVLKQVTKNVYYLENIGDNTDLNSKLPFIIFAVANKKPISADNHAIIYKVTYQITLVTKKRSEALALRLQDHLNNKEFPHQMISSYQNDDYTLNRVYQVEIITKGGY